MISVGKILRSQGERGELRLLFYHKEQVELSELTKVYIGKEPPLREFRVESIEPRGKGYHIKLAGIDSLSEADRLAGFEVFVPEETLKTLQSDEYYAFQLKGCAVLDKDEKVIGMVADVLSFPAQELLLVKGQGKEILIPFHQSICREVDLTKKEIRIEPPEGLLE